MIKELASKNNLEKNKSVGEFENSLYESGIYKFNFDETVRELEIDIQRAKSWYDNNPGWDEKRTAESLSSDIIDAQYEFHWRMAFDGKVPKSWTIWHDPREAFIDAGKLGFQLNKILVDAGVSYPHHLVANEAGKSQKLTENQLAIVMARPNFPYWNLDEIIEAQLSMGMSRQTVDKARQRAEEIKEKMRKEEAPGKFFAPLRRLMQGKGDLQALEDTTNEFSYPHEPIKYGSREWAEALAKETGKHDADWWYNSSGAQHHRMISANDQQKSSDTPTHKQDNRINMIGRADMNEQKEIPNQPLLTSEGIPVVSEATIKALTADVKSGDFTLPEWAQIIDDEQPVLNRLFQSLASAHGEKASEVYRELVVAYMAIKKQAKSNALNKTWSAEGKE